MLFNSDMSQTNMLCVLSALAKSAPRVVSAGALFRTAHQQPLAAMLPCDTGERRALKVSSWYDNWRPSVVTINRAVPLSI